MGARAASSGNASLIAHICSYFNYFLLLFIIIIDDGPRRVSNS